MNNNGLDSMRAFSLLHYGEERRGEPWSKNADAFTYYHRQADIDVVTTGNEARLQSPGRSAGNSALSPSSFEPTPVPTHRLQGSNRSRDEDSAVGHKSRSPSTPGQSTNLGRSQHLAGGAAMAPIAFGPSSQAHQRHKAESPGQQEKRTPRSRTPNSTTPVLRTPCEPSYSLASTGHRLPSQRSSNGSSLRTPPSTARSKASTPPSSDGTVSRGSRCRVSSARVAEDNNELSVREGDVLFVSNEAGGWVYGLLAGLPGTLDEDRSGEGWLPKDILETVD